MILTTIGESSGAFVRGLGWELSRGDHRQELPSISGIDLIVVFFMEAIRSDVRERKWRSWKVARATTSEKSILRQVFSVWAHRTASAVEVMHQTRAGTEKFPHCPFGDSSWRALSRMKTDVKRRAGNCGVAGNATGARTGSFYFCRSKTRSIRLLPMKITVSWPAFPANEQVVGYDVRVTFNGAPTIIDVGPNTQHVIDPAAAGTYAFCVRGRNIVGAGQFGPSYNITAAPSTPTVPPVVVVTA